jgi:hypothetical protein
VNPPPENGSSSPLSPHDNDNDVDSDSSNVIQVVEMITSGVPFILISVCYLLIFIKMRGSKRTLQHLGIAAFNKHVKEVGDRVFKKSL